MLTLRGDSGKHCQAKQAVGVFLVFFTHLVRATYLPRA